uniref:AIG1-type G domain-containing protein n=1 Tax=Mola mola TaxID=94237 RepID=A0A3Q4ADN1_MOLML
MINRNILGRHPPERRLLILGGAQSGKTSTANTILGDDVFDSGTETTHSNVGHTEIYGRRVTVVDTPSWGPCMGAILCPPGPHAILLVVSVTQPFTDIHRMAAEEQLGALGGGTWRYSMVVFTGVDNCGDWLGRTPIEEHILRGGRELQRLLEYCGNYYHVLDSKTPGKDRSVSVLLDKIEEMIRENGDKAFLPIQTEWCKRREDLGARVLTEWTPGRSQAPWENPGRPESLLVSWVPRQLDCRSQSKSRGRTHSDSSSRPSNLGH